MVRKVLIAVALVALIVGGGGSGTSGSAIAQEDKGFHCTEGSDPRHLRNSDARSKSGSACSRWRNPDRHRCGCPHIRRGWLFPQLDNIKGSVTGIVPDRPGSGTYQVNADCTGITLFQPAPGITIEERMVIVDHGNEIRTIVSSPQTTMVSTVQKRIDHR